MSFPAAPGQDIEDPYKAACRPPSLIMTYEELKHNLHYEPETGDFTWIQRRGRKIKPGDPAGTTNNRGYIMIYFNGKPYSSHRLAYLYMTGKKANGLIDHINHIKTDNRWVNLRVVDTEESNKNLSKAKNNTSGCVGVFRDRDKWRAQITVSKKRISLGQYDKIEDAVKARKKAEKEYSFHQNHGIPL